MNSINSKTDIWAMGIFYFKLIFGIECPEINQLYDKFKNESITFENESIFSDVDLIGFYND
jgi:hypothetical protein